MIIFALGQTTRLLRRRGYARSTPIKGVVTKVAEINATAKPQLRLTRPSPAYMRVTIDNPPINVMGPEMVREFQEIMGALEADEHVRVVVFD